MLAVALPPPHRPRGGERVGSSSNDRGSVDHRAAARDAAPPKLGAFDAASVAALVATQLEPQLASSAAALAGPRARAATVFKRVRDSP
jgi:hypothetical protein